MHIERLRDIIAQADTPLSDGPDEEIVVETLPLTTTVFKETALVEGVGNHVDTPPSRSSDDAPSDPSTS